MRLWRRLADALSSPRRLIALFGRVGQLAARGELGAMLARVRPRGPMPAEYRAWRMAQPPIDSGKATADFIVLVDFERGAAEALLRDRRVSLPEARAVLVRAENGEWQRGAEGPIHPLGRWLADLDAASSWLWWITAPMEFEPGAASAIGEACALEHARVVYADHDLADEKGRPALPVHKPAWDDQQILERNYPGPWLVVHALLATSIGSARRPGTAGPWRLLLEAVGTLASASFVHVPRVLAHLPAAPTGLHVADAREREALRHHVEAAAARRGEAVDAEPQRTPWIRFHGGDAAASIVIPTRDRPELLERCLATLQRSRTARNAEVVIVDHGSTDPRVAQLLDAAARSRNLAVVAVAGEFNFPRLCNAGVAAATGRVVVLLNNDTEPGEDDWLDELVALAIRRGIGAVGPLLRYPDGRLQSAGVLLGVNRTATSALAGFDARDPAARSWCASRRRVSAVMGACLAVERSKYQDVGGFDERFAVSHNELDFCLRLEAAGHANLFTPFASVVHEEGATRGFEVTPAERERLAGEERLFRSRWGSLVEGTDPAHHPCLAREGNPFALAATVGDLRPRAGWRVHGAATSPGQVRANG